MSELPAGCATSWPSRSRSRRSALEREARARDGTVKALFATADGRPVEAVLMRYRDARRSICLSSQSGCPLTCSFCATGAMRFGRNLTASEILDQALHFRRVERSDHCVFMGMGEPLLNLDNVLAACERLPDLGVTHRRTAISTVGWIPGIERLAVEGRPCGSRSRCTPPTRRCAPSSCRSTSAIRSPTCSRPAARHYARRRRKIFVEYVMLAGVNDRDEQAVALAGVLDPRVFKVNLIPYNPTGGPFQGSSREAIEAFRAALEQRGCGLRSA